MFEQEEYVNAILKLARVERIIIALHIIQGMELKEIAYLLNTSVDSVYTQKNTALKQLKTELEKINSTHNIVFLLKYIFQMYFNRRIMPDI